MLRSFGACHVGQGDRCQGEDVLRPVYGRGDAVQSSKQQELNTRRSLYKFKDFKRESRIPHSGSQQSLYDRFEAKERRTPSRPRRLARGVPRDATRRADLLPSTPESTHPQHSPEQVPIGVHLKTTCK